MVDIKKILVPTDFSDGSMAAVQYARELAPGLGAEVLLLHVLPSPLYPFALNTTSVPTLEKELRHGVAQRLEELAVAEQGQGIEARAVMRSGIPFSEVIDTAKDEEVDLIVMSTHGYSGIKHLMLGSLAEKVVRSAPCPVLVVPPAAT